MLARMWIKENPYAPLIRKISIATMEIHTEVSRKLKISLLYKPAYHTSEYLLKRHLSQHITDTCTLLFTVALFTAAKLQNQTKCLATEECLRKMWYIHKGIFSALNNNNKVK